MTLLFPMHELFERYVAVQLRRALASEGYEVVEQGGFAYCLGPWDEGRDVVGTSHATRPDILVKRDGKVIAVVDTKWKHLGDGVSASDLYQMMAYSRLYNCRRLILLYPALPGTAARIDTHGIPRGNDRLDVAAVQLERPVSEIQSALRKLCAVEG